MSCTATLCLAKRPSWRSRKQSTAKSPTTLSLKMKLLSDFVANCSKHLQSTRPNGPNDASLPTLIYLERSPRRPRHVYGTRPCVAACWIHLAKPFAQLLHCIVNAWKKGKVANKIMPRNLRQFWDGVDQRFSLSLDLGCKRMLFGSLVRPFLWCHTFYTCNQGTSLCLPGPEFH